MEVGGWLVVFLVVVLQIDVNLKDERYFNLLLDGKWI